MQNVYQYFPNYQATAFYSEDNFKYPINMKKKILKIVNKYINE